MGIYERDYMGGSSNGDDPDPPFNPDPDPEEEPPSSTDSSDEAWAGFGVQVLMIFGGLIALLIVLRFPSPPAIKLTLAATIVVISIWCVIRAPGRSRLNQQHRQGWLCESRGDFGQAINHYQRAMVQKPQSSALKVRLLAAYHGAGQTKDARDFLRQIDRARFDAVNVEELEFLLSKYGEGKLEELGNRWILLLD
ncbi:MAG: hypothetical protein ACI8UO_004807 [Verrucomicrobiales bacterium]|jgi:hypothetical protein